MKNSCLLICTLFLAVTGYAQSPLETALKEIERNNPDLKAAVAGLDEDRLANRSETLLANPEIEFNYLWGADNLGGRRDVRISQSFDLATVSGLKTEKGACAWMNWPPSRWRCAGWKSCRKPGTCASS